MRVGAGRSDLSTAGRFYGLVGAVVAAAALLLPATAQAALPELRIAPLRYDQQLEIGRLQQAVIDTANPTGSSLHVSFEVQGFRQVQGSRDGELEFYDDPRLTAAIVPLTPAFDLGPREAVRTTFTIDPAKLGPGGTYAVVFARASTPPGTGNVINTNARVGTLLILGVGGRGTRQGRLSGVSLPHFIYGHRAVAVGYDYTNTGQSQTALAFQPSLTTSFGGLHKQLTGPFVFPGHTRPGSVTLDLGHRFGLTRLTVRDTTGGGSIATAWVFLVTGYWTWLTPCVLGIICVIAAVYIRSLKRRKTIA